MSYKLERLSDLPVLHLSFAEDVQFAEFVERFSDDVFNALEKESRAVYYLIDVRNLKLSFNDILNGVQLGTKSGHSNLRHRNIKQVIVISQSKAIATVAKGLNTVSFGNINAVVFELSKLR
jgi:hypothetical protein